jgi:RNA polymerase sigma factor (sigma-70 family)
MATRQFSPVIRYINRIAIGQASHLTDSALLDRFAHGHDDEAFAVLVHRHARLVLGACRRIVQDCHAAEDCFQAVFLVLASKARSLQRTESLGPWLHAVAIRVALKAKAQAKTRRKREMHAAVGVLDDRGDDLEWREMRPLLDDAIARLASKYRVPFILCYLQGRTVIEIARELGQPRGTVAARLARAREQLRTKLVRRGITLSAAGLAAALSESLATACVPPSLAGGTIKSAGLVAAGRAAVAAFPNQPAALMEGALRSMFLAKMKFAVGALAIVAIGTAVLGFSQEQQRVPKALPPSQRHLVTDGPHQIQVSTRPVTNVCTECLCVEVPADFCHRVGLQDDAQVTPAAYVLTSREARMLAALIRTDSTVKTLSRPQISTLDGQTGEIHVGSIPSLESSVVDGKATNAPTPANVALGNALKVTPQIVGEPDSIELRVLASQSSAGSLVHIGEGKKVPSFNVQQIDTTVRIPDGGTVVIRGLLAKPSTSAPAVETLWIMTGHIVKGEK